MPHSVSALIITSTASEAPGVRGRSPKLYVIVPSRTPFTTESIFASNGAAASFMKNRLRMVSSGRSIQHEREQCIACCSENVLMAVDHIRLRRIRHLADAAMPQSFAVRRIERYEVSRIVTREQQLAGCSEDPAHHNRRA